MLYCVGAQRAGTSWLDAMFRGHPRAARAGPQGGALLGRRPAAARRLVSSQGGAGSRLVPRRLAAGAGAALSRCGRWSCAAQRSSGCSRRGSALYDDAVADHACLCGAAPRRQPAGAGRRRQHAGLCAARRRHLRRDGGARRRALHLRDARPRGAALVRDSSTGSARRSQPGTIAPEAVVARFAAARRGDDDPRRGALGLPADDRARWRRRCRSRAALPLPRDAVQPGSL